MISHKKLVNMPKDKDKDKVYLLADVFCLAHDNYGVLVATAQLPTCYICY